MSSTWKFAELSSRIVPQAALWREGVQGAAEPFIFDKAIQFAAELHAFVLSGMSLASYDLHTLPGLSRGATPRVP